MSSLDSTAVVSSAGSNFLTRREGNPVFNYRVVCLLVSDFLGEATVQRVSKNFVFNIERERLKYKAAMTEEEFSDVGPLNNMQDFANAFRKLRAEAEFYSVHTPKNSWLSPRQYQIVSHNILKTKIRDMHIDYSVRLNIQEKDINHSYDFTLEPEHFTTLRRCQRDFACIASLGNSYLDKVHLMRNFEDIHSWAEKARKVDFENDKGTINVNALWISKEIARCKKVKNVSIYLNMFQAARYFNKCFKYNHETQSTSISIPFPSEFFQLTELSSISIGFERTSSPPRRSVSFADSRFCQLTQLGQITINNFDEQCSYFIHPSFPPIFYNPKTFVEEEEEPRLQAYSCTVM